MLDDRVLYEASEEDKRRKNFRAMISRYLSEAIPDVRVRVRLFGFEKEVVTDENGLFEALFEFEEELPQHGWHTASFKVLDILVDDQKDIETETEVYIEEPNSCFGIISDVDDTILISHATQTLRKLRLILTKNSKTRLPFTGVAAFYDALRRGTKSESSNPIFYVSSSEWNLYDFLENFCEVRNIPKGPFLLQELKTSLWELMKSGGGTHNHKLIKIRHLFEVYKDLSFILIGDSGQRDSELYVQITQEFPGRVKAIYIRDVSKKSKEKKVLRQAEDIKALNVDMLLVSDTAVAAEHAYSKGFINEEELQQVIKETREQEGRSESLVGQIVEGNTE
ncbi:App1 family protein [Fulvivirga sediminis]|uniref:DUF2183 domain-containing protein n=1 Tax=Fulvivirga sediminis TaxID=2803949 RepID=A0A937F1T0_9BACT|nr:phosphatase domain-containing protein [Fulvivirga sediminis]MBL3654711.1 DUF2183 domain-containing protein [Fulvivirga sediminis]